MLYTAENREIKTDPETGSKYWAARLDKLMFTWFDVPPGKTFAGHAHEGEQITYVLDGTLFFEINKQEYCLMAGDCICIPSNTKHKVWTESSGAKAVDAWSPINQNYK